ncbi:GAF domain protein [Anaeromyxobacter sp. K]|uniref:GAF domain-containing protein n=1 Tax=Anaeromyxobacter sp. (strain K) TaxID=447217 RepID=UPI00015F9DCC|nr:GAF domain-containing protein [Anaeromyxobacter sp. K]ACG71878.1 GAF domain protein [Anaeromyxobacter sp. K]
MSDIRGKPGGTGRDLQQVNEKLRELISSLRTEKERLSESRHSASTPAPVPAAAEPSPPAAVDLEKKRLAAELALAREAVEHATAERARLRDRLAEIEAEHQRVSDDYVAVEERHSELAQLFVALERIHGAPTRAEVLTALQEIVINVVGTEELALLEVRDGKLVLAHAFGVAPGPLREIALGEGAIGRTARTGRLYVAGRDGSPDEADRDLTACIPLRVGDRVTAVLAIFRLLGHKPGLGESDQAVFDLLSAHAGLALHLRAQAERAGAAS